MHRSKLDIGGADAGSGGMSISSGLDGAGSGSTCLEKRRPLRRGIAVGTQWKPPSCPSLVLVTRVRDCARRPVDDRRRQSGPEQLLKLRTATSQGCKHDIRNVARMAAMVASLAWMLAMSQRRIHDCPFLPGFITSSKAESSAMFTTCKP